jgi:surface protein
MAHMLRNLGVLTTIDVSNWDVSSCRDIGYLFHRCPSLRYVDVSKWNTANVETMENTFNRCEKLENLDVSNWNTSSCKNMISTFQHCYALTELNLSNWDTSYLEPHPIQSTPMKSMLYYMNNLQKIALGDKFSFTGDISVIMSVPSSTYIPYADGRWYDYDYNTYALADIPNNVARTYYASKFIAAEDDKEMVFVKNGTLRKMAVALRHKNGKTDTMYPSEFAEEVLAL